MSRPFVDNFIFFDSYPVDKLSSVVQWLDTNQLDAFYRNDGFGSSPKGDGRSFYGIKQIDFPAYIFCNKNYTNKWQDFCTVIDPLITFMKGQVSLIEQCQPWNVNINIVPPGLNVKPHVDNHLGVGKDYRVHLVLDTNNAVEFTVEDQTKHFPQGSCFAFDNTKIHSVANKHESLSRTHLIVDFRPIT